MVEIYELSDPEELKKAIADSSGYWEAIDRAIKKAQESFMGPLTEEELNDPFIKQELARKYNPELRKRDELMDKLIKELDEEEENGE